MKLGVGLQNVFFQSILATTRVREVTQYFIVYHIPKTFFKNVLESTCLVIVFQRFTILRGKRNKCSKLYQVIRTLVYPGQKCISWTKMSIPDKNVNPGQKCPPKQKCISRTKMYTPDNNIYLGQKCQLRTKMYHPDKNVNPGQKYLYGQKYICH